MYLMEDPREAERLRKKSDPESFDKIFFSPYIKRVCSIKTKGNLNVLDVGCGSGSIIAYLARKYPKINFVGFDINNERFKHEESRNKFRPNLEYHVGNAYALPFKKNKFDFVFSRFLFEYLIKPTSVLKEMTRVAARGGIVVLQDLDGQLISNYPVGENFSNECGRVVRSLEKSGFDVYVGRKLFHYAKICSLRNINVEIHPYHLFAGKIDPKNYDLWKTKLEIAMPQLIKAFQKKETASRFKRRYLDYLLNKDSLKFSLLFTIAGLK